MVEKEINPKFNNLYKEMFNEISNQLGLKSSIEKFKKIQFSYLTNLDKFFHKKCTNEFEWVKKNSIIKEGKMEPAKGIDNKEYEKKTTELNECIKRNDKGLTEVVANFEKEFRDFNEKITQDVTVCAKMKQDDEMKKCIREKLLAGSKNLMEVFGKYEKQFETLNDNIKL